MRKHPLFCLLLCDDSEKYQVFVTVIDERMGLLFRAVVAVVGFQTFHISIAHRFALATEHIYYFATRVMCVEAD